MGTLCKNCPFKNAKREEGRCTDLFVKKFHNSCVTYDIVEDKFMEELEEFGRKMKTETKKMTKKEQNEFNEALQHINKEMPKTETFEIKTETYDENIVSN